MSLSSQCSLSWSYLEKPPSPRRPSSPSGRWWVGSAARSPETWPLWSSAWPGSGASPRLGWWLWRRPSGPAGRRWPCRWWTGRLSPDGGKRSSGGFKSLNHHILCVCVFFFRTHRLGRETNVAMRELHKDAVGHDVLNPANQLHSNFYFREFFGKHSFL